MASTGLIKKRVVVIGYGAAGSQFAAKAAKNKAWEVTVVTPFEYQEVSLRMTSVVAIGPEAHEKAIYPLLREDGVNYVFDTVESIEDGSLRTTGGTEILFDAAVVAVGQRIPVFYPNPSTERTVDERKAAISAFHSEIRRANNIVISGGGPVGVETAADIKLRFKDKSITVVHPASDILNSMNDPFRLKAHAHLEKIGVKLVVSERVSRFENGEVSLSSGGTLPADLFITAHAVGGNATFLPGDSKNEKGYAHVDDTFKVHGLSRVFALGDCSDYDPVKTYPRIDDQLPTLYANIEAVLSDNALLHHVRGKSFTGQFKGPLMVALGHDHPEGYGVGPDLPGCLGGCCWFCCCCGPPCSTPAGPGVAKAKSDFNQSVFPHPGKGLSG